MLNRKNNLLSDNTKFVIYLIAFTYPLLLAWLGPMYSCTLYSCTRVHILEYSDVLCTHVLLA